MNGENMDRNHIIVEFKVPSSVRYYAFINYTLYNTAR